MSVDIADVLEVINIDIWLHKFIKFGLVFYSVGLVSYSHSEKEADTKIIVVSVIVTIWVNESGSINTSNRESSELVVPSWLSLLQTVIRFN